MNYLLSGEKKCDIIIGNPMWDIAYFAPNKIIGEWGWKALKFIN